jgi:membrane protease YdiL (CAAX protease family)
VVGLALAVAGITAPFAREIIRGSDIVAALVRELLLWGLVALVLLWVTQVEQLPLSSIGVRRLDGKSLRLALLAGAMVSAVMVVDLFVVLPRLGISAPEQVRQGILARPLWFRLLVVARAAVAEEIVFRGYAIERLEYLTRSRAAAVVISSVAFGLAHARGWGAVQIVPTAIAGLIFGVLYLQRRNLPANVVAHFFTDAWGFLFK